MNREGPDVFDARLHLLDRQVVDVDGVPVVTVADVELTELPAGKVPQGTPAPRITALLSGPSLATRIFGGKSPERLLHRIEWRHLRRLGTALELDIPGEDLDATWAERWVRDRIIRKIPGGSHDPQ
ncbi:hypothetical protein [Arthrobacter sp. B3I4]|uniref:hypothetical protein n=1 Tax=Arthrobacter sp. B3I4 TaxID=3042267 RepID=UPI002783C562|nr:hypothetical protein [Arthrobacter sp. B3I4]MDQ0756645.1 hypothetical protein [Arthrobacter sp. B3I4]